MLSSWADPDLGFFAVADGMGGDAAGEIASHLVLDTLRKAIAESRKNRETDFSPNQTVLLSPPSALLVNGIRLANQAVFQSSQEKEEYRGMGTTVVALNLSNSSAVVAHVGDSRLYRVGGRRIDRITEDQSLGWEQERTQLAPQRGGKDNITILIIQIE